MSALRNVEIRMPKGSAQQSNPWRVERTPGLKRWSLEMGFGGCDYLYLRGTTKAIMTAARELGATETDLVEALVDDDDARGCRDARSASDRRR